MGKRQRITVTSLPAVAITIVIAFPNRTRFIRHVSAQDDGYFRLIYKQPKGRTTTENHVVKVTVKVIDATGATKHSIKKYRVP
ncbi:MAG: hypothetical protein ACRDFX_02165 [Chloroflexota bacterium]